jgi:hypothetical protein
MSARDVYRISNATNPYHFLLRGSQTKLAITPNLLCLLLHMRREIVGCIVGVDEGSIDDWHGFEDVLQALTQVMTVSQ